MGEYKEKLKTGGELVVNPTNWYIKYYFPGPDLRYNGTFVRINSKDIDMYINAWKSNFEEYLTLKNTLNLEGTFEKKGEAGMKISIGGYKDGVTIDGWHMAINKQEMINDIVDDYELAKEKAIKIQELIQSI